MEYPRSQRYRSGDSLFTGVPEAPGLNSIPDIDSFLSAGGDSLFDINPSQYIKPTQKRQQDIDNKERERHHVSASGDGPVKKAKVYPVIHKVDPKLVSRNGKKACSFVVPHKTPGQRKIMQARTVYSSQEDIFEESSSYFEQASPHGDSLHTPAPLIVPVASQAAGKMKLRSVTEIGILTILACLKEISGRAIIYGVTLPSMSISGLDVLVKAFEVMSKALSAETYRSIFDFPYFNIVQSKVFDDVMYTDKPMVLCSPTGSGKTAVFEMAIVRLMTRASSNISSIKIVYMAPIKALCSERYTDWKEKLEPLGLKCMELTGDTEIDDFYRLQEVQVILTTPEKWDSMTRKWRDNKGVMQAICLFLIDEIHILNDPSRGSTVEAVVTRMKTMQAARARTSVDIGLPLLRFIAVSATITNIEDVAEWLGNSRSRAIFYKMDDRVRPVRLRKVVLGYFYAENKQSEFQFDLTLSYKLATVIKTYSEDKPTLVFCSTRKSAQQSAEILSKDMKSSFIKSAQHRQQLNNLSYHIKDVKLRDLICKGIGYHHAGMDLQDRKNIEETFASGDLPVLVSTSTLAMGVNLPAHLVIIKSTMFYNLGVYQEYPDIQVLQMIGRAGRPQFDTSATAVIMTKNQTKMKYENLLNGTQLIESSLHKNLTEHLNAEIVLHTISDISVAVEWLRYTFLYIRVFKNPKHYELCQSYVVAAELFQEKEGLPLGLSKDSLEKRLQDMCMKDLKQLNSLNMISMDEENLDVKPQESGKLMARYCLSFKTMQLFSEVTGAETVAEMVSLVSKCQEFMDIQLRTNEKKSLNTLNRDKNRMTIRYPLQGKIKTTDMKVNCLIQTAFGSLMLQDFALQQDTSRIFRAGIRVTRCLVELLWQKQDFKALLSAVQLCKSFKAKLWDDSKFVSKQLDGIGPALSNALVNAGITTFEKIEDMNPREIELIVNRHPPFGNQVRESVSCLPKYELVIEQMTRYAVSTSEVVITIQLSDREILKDKTSTNHTSTLLIGDQDNKVVFKQRIMDAQLLKEGSWSRKLDIKHAAKGPDLFIHYVSQEWVGLDIECTFTPNYLGGRRITNTTSSLSPKTKGIMTKIPVPDTGKGENYVPCNHSCLNKQACAHECCKTGVSIRKRQQKSHDTSNRSHDTSNRSHDTSSRSCGKGVLNHISEIQSRVSNMPLTPGQLKRPRLEFKINPDMAKPAADLSKYSYTPRKSYTYDLTEDQTTDWQPDDDIELDNKVVADQTDLLDVKSGRNSDWVGTNPQSITARKTADWAELDLFQKHREQYCTDDIDQTDQDQHSLPDLVFNSPEPVKTDPLDPRVEDNQQEYGDEDVAHETEFGYFYVQGEDMNKLPTDWDDQVTELSGARKYPQNNSKSKRQEKSLSQNKPAIRRPLFKNRLKGTKAATDNQDYYMYESGNPEISVYDTDYPEANVYETDNLGAIDENQNEVEIIETFDSDNEQTESRWNGFVDSQSSENTDYLNQPFPARLENRHKLIQSCKNVKRHSDIGPGLSSKFGVDSLQSTECQRVSLKPDFLKKCEANRMNRSDTQAFRDSNASQYASMVNENKENIWFAEKEVTKLCPLSENRSSYWENRRTPQKLPKYLEGQKPEHKVGDCWVEKGQNHKFGQVLAWVSNSQNKVESQLEPEWDEWSDETDALMEADQTDKPAGENTTGMTESISEEKTVDSGHIKENPVSDEVAVKSPKPQKQGHFSSFFSAEQPQEPLDSFSNIFDGIF